MTRHLASTRSFPGGYSQTHPTVATSDAFRGRPGSGGALVVSLVTIPQPVALGGQPFLGMDPSAPATWTRPYNPQPGMVARLNFDGAKMQTDTPMGQTWRNPLRDRADVPAGPVQHAGRSKRTWRRRLWPTARRCCITVSTGRQPTTRRRWVRRCWCRWVTRTLRSRGRSSLWSRRCPGCWSSRSTGTMSRWAWRISRRSSPRMVRRSRLPGRAGGISWHWREAGGMDEIDSWLVALGLAGLGVATLLLAHALRALQEDVALLRITAAVPEIERHT